VVAIAEDYARWLAASPLPKLFVNADPGTILTGAQREFCRTWPNQTEVTVPGSHFIQEDSGREIGEAIVAAIEAFDGTGKPYLHISGVWVYGDNTEISEASPFNPPAMVAWMASAASRGITPQLASALARAISTSA